MFRTKVVQKIKIHILCSVTFFLFPENRTVFGTMWENTVQPDRPQMTILQRGISHDNITERNKPQMIIACALHAG